MKMIDVFEPKLCKTNRMSFSTVKTHQIETIESKHVPDFQVTHPNAESLNEGTWLEISRHERN